jgi:hypothetical protein
MNNTLIAKRNDLNNQIAATPCGQDVSSLLAARNWYNKQISRYERALEIMRNTRPDSPMYEDCLAEVRQIRGDAR